ncbi:MAG: M50 family metallopeptidase [Acidobacteriota bacterium]
MSYPSPNRSFPSGRGRRLAAGDRARVVLLASTVVTFLLYVVPYGEYLAYPLLLLSTLAHEMGHGLTAILVGGSFHRFLMWPDGSGVAVWSGEPSRLRMATVAFGGLVGPAVAAALGFIAGRTPRGARAALWLLVVTLALSLLFVVRNSFGILFVALLGLALLLVAKRGSAEVIQLVLVFLALQLALSVFSRADYLFTPVARTSEGVMPSDVAQIADALFLPYWFWGGLCAGFSILVLILGLRSYWR